MVDVDPRRFDEMVSEALDGIPGELGELMSNVATDARIKLRHLYPKS
jgi:predicted Zn-dependent protease with MMP-like domain